MITSTETMHCTSCFSSHPPRHICCNQLNVCIFMYAGDTQLIWEDSDRQNLHMQTFKYTVSMHLAKRSDMKLYQLAMSDNYFNIWMPVSTNSPHFANDIIGERKAYDIVYPYRPSALSSHLPIRLFCRGGSRIF